MFKRLTDDSKSWFISWYQEWSQVWEGDCNWYTITPIHIEFENDKVMGGYEAVFVLFGLGFRWRWNHTETERMRDCLDAVAEIRAGTAKTRPLSEFLEEMRKNDSDVVN